MDGSDLDDGGTTGFVASEEMIAGGGGLGVGLDCFTDDGPVC